MSERVLEEVMRGGVGGGGTDVRWSDVDGETCAVTRRIPASPLVRERVIGRALRRPLGHGSG